MKYFLDTNICVYFLKGTDPAVARRLLSHPPEDIRIPSIVKAELLYGAYRSDRRDENLERIEQFLLPLTVVAFGDRQADRYATIRADLEGRGQVIGPNDLIVAATVVEAGGALVTNNEREFGRVRDLRVENWVEA